MWPHKVRLNNQLNILPERLPSQEELFKVLAFSAVIRVGGLMTILGLMLWTYNLVLASLPVSFLQFTSIVYFDEAVLAVLAILLCHIYSAILDPEV